MNELYDRPREYLTLFGQEPVDHVPKDKNSPNFTIVEGESGRGRYYLMHAGSYSEPRVLHVNERHVVPNPAFGRWEKANTLRLKAKKKEAA